MGVLDAPALDAFGRALTGTLVRRWLGNRVGFDGDSITRGIVGSTGGDSNAELAGSNGVVCADSAPTYAMLASGGRWVHVTNQGVAGQRSDQILARQAATLAYGLDVIVYVSPGYMNNLFQGRDVALTISDIEGMIVGAQRAGVVPVICTPTPDGIGTPTSDRNVWLRTVRAQVINLCASYGVPCVDVWTPLVDASGGTLQAAFNVDGSVHPKPAAYNLMGQAIEATLRTIIPPMASPRVTDKGTGTPDLMDGAGLFYGTVAAGVPGGWTWSPGSTTPSVESPTDIIGKAFRVTSSAGNGTGQVARDISTRFAVGDLLEFSGLVAVSAAGIKAEAQLFATGAASNVREVKPVTITPGGQLPRGHFAKRYVVPANTTKLTVYLKVSGGVAGYAEWAEIGVTNLTALGLA